MVRSYDISDYYLVRYHIFKILSYREILCKIRSYLNVRSYVRFFAGKWVEGRAKSV